MGSETGFDGFEVFFVVGFFEDDVAAMIEFGECLDGIGDLDKRRFGEFYRFEVQVVDDQCFFLSIGFGIHPGDKPISNQNGQRKIAVLPFWLGNKTFYLVVEVEKIS